MFVSNRYCSVEPEIAHAVHSISNRRIKDAGERVVLQVGTNELSSSFRFIVTQQQLAKTFGRRPPARNHFFPCTLRRRQTSRRDALLAPQSRDALNTKQIG